MKTVRTHRIILFLIVLATGMASVSCDQPTGDQMQVQEEAPVAEVATSFETMARFPGFDTKDRKCPEAVLDLYLQIPGIESESEAQDADQRGQIEIFSWIWGTSGRASSSHSGRGKGRAKVKVQPFVNTELIGQPFVITKPTDRASPELRRLADSRESIAEVVLTIRMTCGEQREFFEIELEDVVITSYQSAGSSQRTTAEKVAIGCKTKCEAKVEFEWKVEPGK